MEYRIKMIQKNNGSSVFIPEYRDYDWCYVLGLKIVLAPILFIYWLWFDRKLSSILDCFSPWNKINFDGHIFSPEYICRFFMNNSDTSICDNKEDAGIVIKMHSNWEQQKINIELDAEHKRQGEKTKKILYIKVK